MASTSWLFPSGTVDMADDYNGILSRNSTNAANTMAEDNAFASLTSGKNHQFENAPMRAFGFSLASVPAGATITGFEMRMSCYALAPGQFDTAVSDSLVRPLIHSGRTTYQNVNTGAAIAKADQIGQNLASSTLWPTPEPANKAFRTYGGPTNMWGVSEAQLRNPNFGFDLLLAGGGKAGATGYVDSFQLRVHYEGGAPAGPEPITGTGSGTVSGPTGSATGTSVVKAIMGTGSGQTAAPTASANGVSKITGVASATVSAPSATVSARLLSYGIASASIAAPTASVTASSGYRGQGSGSTVAPTASANGSSAISGYGAGTNPTYNGLVNGGSKLSGQGSATTAAPSATALGSSAITGQGSGSITAPMASAEGVSVVPGANGVGFGQSDGPTGLAFAKLSMKGQATVAATGPTGSANGRSKIRGTATATISAPSATALGKMGERGTASGQIANPTGSAAGYSWLMEALPGTSISAEFDGRALAADNDDRSLSADPDSRSAG